MSDRTECAECPLKETFDDGLDDFDGTAPALCCGVHTDPFRCESCGVPLVKHLGLTGTCAKLIRCQDKLEIATQDAGLYLSLLRRVIRMNCLTVERCPAGYPDVAEFLSEEAALTTKTPSEEGKENDEG